MANCTYCCRVTRLRPLCSAVVCLRMQERDDRRRSKGDQRKTIPPAPVRIAWQPSANAATFRAWK